MEPLQTLAVFTKPGASLLVRPTVIFPWPQSDTPDIEIFPRVICAVLPNTALALLPRVAKIEIKWVSSAWNMLVMYFLSNSGLFKCILDDLFYQCTKKSTENSVCISMTAMNNRKTTILKTNSQGEDSALKTMAHCWQKPETAMGNTRIPLKWQIPKSTRQPM